jgi:dTDP-glucose 4,6-dehydratase
MKTMGENPTIRADLDYVLNATESLWAAFRHSRLLITGGTGFVGKWLLESFLYANDNLSLRAEAVVLSRNPAAFAVAHSRLARHPSISMWPGDVRSFDFPPGVFTHAIHGATDVSTSVSPLDTFDATVNGTRRVLDFCKQKGVADLLLISSGAVYGRQPVELACMDENYVGAPQTTKLQSAYGEGKRAAEWLATAYGGAGGPAVRIARCFAFVGPYLPLNSHFAIGNFIRDVLASRAVNVSGDGTTIRSYLYAADLAKWLWVILARGKPGEAYNVGAEEPVNMGDLARRIARLGRETLPVEFARSPLSGILPDRYVPCTRKARESLGLDITIDLDGALSRTLAWARTADSYPG